MLYPRSRRGRGTQFANDCREQPMNLRRDYFELCSRGITFAGIFMIFALGTTLASMTAAAYPQNSSLAPAAVTPKVKIAKIDIQGNHALTTAQIKSAMKLIKEGSSSSVPTGKDTTELKLHDDVTR